MEQETLYTSNGSPESSGTELVSNPTSLATSSCQKLQVCTVRRPVGLTDLEPAMLTANCLLEPEPTPWRSQREDAASMRVFTTVMMHAWRQRRGEVRQLRQTVDRLHRSSMKVKNQVHVYSTLLRVEQKRNSELQLQLKQSAMNVTEVRSSCDSLTTSVLNLRADKAQLEQELDYRKKEYDSLETIASQTKSDLFSAMMEQRSLQSELSKEQRSVQHLVRENQQLLDEVMKIRNADNEYRQTEHKYRLELEKKDETLQQLRSIVNDLEQQLRDWSFRGKELEHLHHTKQRMTNEIDELRMQISMLQSKCSSRLSLRALNDNISQKYNKKYTFLWRFFRHTSHIVYLFWYYLSPGMPLGMAHSICISTTETT